MTTPLHKSPDGKFIAPEAAFCCWFPVMFRRRYLGFDDRAIEALNLIEQEAEHECREQFREVGKYANWAELGTSDAPLYFPERSMKEAKRLIAVRDVLRRAAKEIEALAA